MGSIESEIGALRNNLLDLTFRNNLLGYKKSDKRTIEIKGIKIDDVYSQLVLKNKSLNLNEILKSSGNTPKETTEKLVYLYNQANTILNDQGCSTLFLAVGFLKWEAKDNSVVTSPILLIPVELKRTGKNRTFQLIWTETDAFTSITLQEKLKGNNVFLPEFDMPEDIEGFKDYFKSLNEAIKHQSGWKIEEEIRVDLFSFKKFVMYKDIDPALWTNANITTEYPLMNKVFGTENIKFVKKFNPEDIDTLIQIGEMHNVVDADSSQLAVIKDAKDGLSEIVEGPPGTGKSQTIVNMIAELVADGKSVLFVAEKLSALSVVKDRLTAVGLGDICLEMHKTNTRKKYVLEELDRTLAPLYKDIHMSDPMNTEMLNNEQAQERVNSKIKQFADYCKNCLQSMSNYVKDCSKCDFNLFRKAKTHNGGSDRKSHKQSEISCIRDDLNEYATLLREPTNTGAYEHFYDMYGVKECVRRHFTNNNDEMILYDISNLSPETWIEEDLDRGIMSLNGLINITKSIQPISENKWYGCVPVIVLPTDIPEITRVLKETIRSGTQLLEALDMLRAKYIISQSLSLVDIKYLLSYSQGENKVKSVIVAQVGLEEYEAMISDITTKYKTFEISVAKLSVKLCINFNTMFNNELNCVPIVKLIDKFNTWADEVDSLVGWSQYTNYRNKFVDTKAGFLISDYEHGKISADDLWYIFIGNYVDYMITERIKSNPILREFMKEEHEHKIERFNELDKHTFIDNRNIVVDNVNKNMRAALLNPSNKDAYDTLQHEINKKRKNIAIRKLMSTSGKLIQKIKPCFMMSPVSVAQFIDPKSLRFDVIIFDEASQIKPEDAVGTFLRGKQAIVMGDSKQLPPTDFFEVMVNTDDLNDYNIVNMESILAVCRRNFVERRLTWHYRSRHESLIAMSNKEFYNNELKVYPSPIQGSENLGLKFKHLPDALYEKGGVNTAEAKVVAEAVFEHYRNNPNKSVMVGTFNVNQQDAITKEIEKLAKKNPDIDLDGGREKFLVKNLETIQGDERDVILLSVGFGFDKDKKLSLNFGALNQNGGERRLNVLVTRAREKCVIFANFRAQDLPVENINSVGLKKLRAFLDFAERGILDTNVEEDEDSETFENAVYTCISNLINTNQSIKNKGFEVKKNVGCAGYKMDLAITNPYNNGEYILGIMCDNENYFMSQVCRDRERLQEQILVGLGWNIYRMWSTDWYLHTRPARVALRKCVIDVINKVISENSGGE
jgi:hypothetical protein